MSLCDDHARMQEEMVKEIKRLLLHLAWVEALWSGGGQQTARRFKDMHVATV